MPRKRILALLAALSVAACSGGGGGLSGAGAGSALSSVSGLAGGAGGGAGSALSGASGLLGSGGSSSSALSSATGLLGSSGGGAGSAVSSASSLLSSSSSGSFGGGLFGGGRPRVMHIVLTASGDLNPGSGGGAFPAQVRLYLLRAPDKFSNADFFQLSDHENAAIGGDLLARNEVIMHPGETRTVDLQSQPDARFVGVAVAYRNINASTWRTVAPVRTNLHLTVGASSVAVAAR